MLENRVRKLEGCRICREQVRSLWVEISGKDFVWVMVLKLDLECGICIGMEQVIPHVGNSRSKGLDSGEEATRRFQEGGHRAKGWWGWLGCHILQAQGSSLPRPDLVIPEIFPSRNLTLFWFCFAFKILASVRKSCPSTNADSRDPGLENKLEGLLSWWRMYPAQKPTETCLCLPQS